MGKVYEALIDQRKGGVLSLPYLGHLLCKNCAERVAATDAAYGKVFWERVAPVFNVSGSWNDL